jgi:hypothetical protein
LRSSRESRASAAASPRCVVSSCRRHARPPPSWAEKALLMIYAHCIDGQADAANKRITDALGTTDTAFGPATREMITVRRCPQVSGQRKEAGWDGLHDRFRPRRLGSSVRRTPPEPGALGYIADGGGREPRLGKHTHRSAAYSSRRRTGVW